MSDTVDDILYFTLTDDQKKTDMVEEKIRMTFVTGFMKTDPNRTRTEIHFIT